jgi:hypothetical protein
VAADVAALRARATIAGMFKLDTFMASPLKVVYSCLYLTAQSSAFISAINNGRAAHD